MSTRINARIDDDLARELERLRRRSGQTLTEIIEAALRAWTKVESRETGPLQAFVSTGFIGSGRGPRDLARNSKKYLRESLERKA